MNKTLFTLILFSCLLGSWAEARTETTVTTIYDLGIGEEEITDGFMMDGFRDHALYSFCYTGNVLKVCGLVNEGSNESRKEYEDGGHEYMRVLECKVRANATVGVTYKIANDWDGSLTSSVIIDRCPAE